MAEASIQIKQEGRMLQASCGSFAADDLIVVGLEGEEEISRPFHFRLGFLSPNQSISPQDIIGQAIAFSVAGPGGDKRNFHGHVQRLSAGGLTEYGYRSYSIDVVPWLWFLTQTLNCRIFELQNSKSVIEQVFGDYGYAKFRFDADTSLLIDREYLVQYRESDFDFVSRLMEEDGLYYYFDHSDSQHELVISNKKTTYFDATTDPVPFRERGFGIQSAVFDWSQNHQFRTREWQQRDYNFETSSTDLKVNKKTVLPSFGQVSSPSLSYDYPGRYPNTGDGGTVTGIRMEEAEAQYAVADGTSDVREFSPGGKFTLDAGLLGDAEGGEFALLTVRHVATDKTHLPGAGGGGASYENGFTAFPSDILYRPPRRTPKAVVRGPQTAVIVSDAPEDEYGRLKVKFHWAPDDQSCLARVSQLWAGRNWGAVFLPRKDMEVVVDFLEGDPDRPIIVGCVYNDANPIPYAQPANRTQSGVKSRSWNSTNKDEANELRFEDKAGNEEILFHAQKDFLREVENDDTITVGNNRSITTKKNLDETVEEGTRTVTIKSDDSLTVQDGSRTATIKNDDTLTVQSGDLSIDVSAGEATLTAANKITLKVGSNTLVIDTSSIKLTVGGSSVKLEQSGVTVSGTQVKVQGSAMAEVNGGGQLTLKGGIVQIN